MSAFEKIHDIFYSGTHAFSGESESINEIAFLVDNGYMRLSTVRIVPKAEHAGILQNVHANPLYDEAAGGGDAHVALKIAAARYLKQKCAQDTLFEHPFCGYYPDALSKDKQTVVECGHTQNPSKMLDYFRQGKIRECIQVPYPDPEDSSILGYCFFAGKDLCDFLEFLAENKRTKTKEVLRKRKA